jgi:hypothetical protein
MRKCHMLSYMEPDAVVGAGADGTAIMGAIEDGSVEQFVIADVTRDGAYLSQPLAGAASLPAWR